MSSRKYQFTKRELLWHDVFIERMRETGPEGALIAADKAVAGFDRLFPEQQTLGGTAFSEDALS